MMTFHEPTDWAMSVMDGRRCVASARKSASYGWILSLRAASWVDPRARKQGLIPGKYPHLLRVRTRPEARRIMEGLATGESYG